MTESELLAHPEFLAFCAIWQRDEWCPYPLIDWFTDRGDERMAEAARWAHEMPERDGYGDGQSKRVFPYSIRNYWFDWVCLDHADDMRSRHFIVPCKVGLSGRSKANMVFAWYFVNFDPELAAKYPPSMFQSHALTQ